MANEGSRFYPRAMGAKIAAKQVASNLLRRPFCRLVKLCPSGASLKIFLPL
jgi:hypothetical protein